MTSYNKRNKGYTRIQTNNILDYTFLRLLNNKTAPYRDSRLRSISPPLSLPLPPSFFSFPPSTPSLPLLFPLLPPPRPHHGQGLEKKNSLSRNKSVVPFLNQDSFPGNLNLNHQTRIYTYIIFLTLNRLGGGVWRPPLVFCPSTLILTLSP